MKTIFATDTRCSKYLYETCHADVEIKDNGGNTSINNASKYVLLEIVEYLYEICHTDVETEDKDRHTPIDNA